MNIFKGFLNPHKVLVNGDRAETKKVVCQRFEDDNILVFKFLGNRNKCDNPRLADLLSNNAGPVVRFGGYPGAQPACWSKHAKTQEAFELWVNNNLPAFSKLVASVGA